MSDRRSLARRVCAELDATSVGLSVAGLAAVLAILVFGLTPTALALGLLALLTVDH